MDITGTSLFRTNFCRYNLICGTNLNLPYCNFVFSFEGWYTTDKHKADVLNNPEECSFIVNKLYAVVSSSISFWIPCTIMIFTYYAIFREANRQEKQLALRQGTAMLMHRHSNRLLINHLYSSTDYYNSYFNNYNYSEK